MVIIASFKTESNSSQNNINLFKLTIIISTKKKKLSQYIIISLKYHFHHQTIPHNLPTTHFPFPLKEKKMKISDLAARHIRMSYAPLMQLVPRVTSQTQV